MVVVKRAYGERTLSITHELMRGVSCGVLNLEILHLQWNNFSVLSDGIKQLKNLKELWFDGIEGSE